MKTVFILLPATAAVSLASLLYQPTADTAEGVGAPPLTQPNASARVVEGPAVESDYGPVSVAISVSGGRIDQVTTRRFPNDLPQSERISKTAIPQLQAAALQAQSAEIVSVSGATYTSKGFKASLAAAIHEAGLS